MDNDNSNNDLITISGEYDINQRTNLNTLTDNIFSILNMETTNRTMPLFS